MAALNVLCKHDACDGKRDSSRSSVELFDGDGPLLHTTGLSHLQVSRIRMHSTLLIKHRILIRIVRRASAYQFSNKSRLAREAGSGKHQRTALPSHHTSVYEDAVRRMIGNMNH